MYWIYRGIHDLKSVTYQLIKFNIPKIIEFHFLHWEVQDWCLYFMHSKSHYKRVHFSFWVSLVGQWSFFGCCLVTWVALSHLGCLVTWVAQSPGLLSHLGCFLFSWNDGPLKHWPWLSCLVLSSSHTYSSQVRNSGM